MDKIRLLEQLTLSRKAIQSDFQRLNDELNFPQKAARAVRSNPVKWLGGALLSGYLFGKLRGRPQPKAPRPGKAGSDLPAKKFGVLAALLALLRFLAPVLRPVLMSYAGRALSKYAL